MCISWLCASIHMRTMKLGVCFFRPHFPLLWYTLLLSCVFACIHSSRGHSHHPGPRTQGPLLSTVLGPWNKRDAAHRVQHYLLGIKRLRRLYCNVGIGFHLQVAPNGQVTGAHNESPYTLLELSPVSRGVVTLFGVRSGLFIAMTSHGKLYGSDHYKDECYFKETLLVNNYNMYESAAYPGMYIGISKTGKVKRGNRVSPTMTMTHFLPRI